MPTLLLATAVYLRCASCRTDEVQQGARSDICIFKVGRTLRGANQTRWSMLSQDTATYDPQIQLWSIERLVPTLATRARTTPRSTGCAPASASLASRSRC
jgi:hypothetical protein